MKSTNLSYSQRSTSSRAKDPQNLIGILSSRKFNKEIENAETVKFPTNHQEAADQKSNPFTVEKEQTMITSLLYLKKPSTNRENSPQMNP